MLAQGQKTRKPRLRSCVACRKSDEKQVLVRFVRLADGEVLCDPTGRKAGRGAYLCAERQCFDRARKAHLLDRALRTKLSEADYQRLEQELASQRDQIDMV